MLIGVAAGALPGGSGSSLSLSPPRGGGVSYDRFPGHCARYRGCGGALMALTRTEMWEAQVVARERMGLPVLEVIPAAIRARALLEVLEVLRLGLA